MNQAIQDGIEAIRREAVAMQGKIALADSLEVALAALGSAEALKAQVTQVLAELDQATKDLDRVKAKAEAIVSDAQAKADAIAAQAKADAQGVADKAAADAQAVADKAAADAAGAVAATMDNAQADIDRLAKQKQDAQAAIADLNAKKEDAQAALASVSSELSDKQRALDSVKVAIAALRA